jgi:hypothetical protein
VKRVPTLVVTNCFGMRRRMVSIKSAPEQCIGMTTSGLSASSSVKLCPFHVCRMCVITITPGSCVAFGINVAARQSHSCQIVLLCKRSQPRSSISSSVVRARSIGPVLNCSANASIRQPSPAQQVRLKSNRPREGRRMGERALARPWRWASPATRVPSVSRPRDGGTWVTR